MRLLAPVVTAFLFASCGSPPPKRSEPARVDITREAWYAEMVAELQHMNRDAERLNRAGKRDEAAQLVIEAQPLVKRLLSAPNPTLAATEAASDVDDLYGRMLFANGRYGWARLQFQKNVARWRSWKPATAETARRLQVAQDAIAECDRRIEQEHQSGKRHAQ